MVVLAIVALTVQAAKEPAKQAEKAASYPKLDAAYSRAFGRFEDWIARQEQLRAEADSGKGKRRRLRRLGVQRTAQQALKTIREFQLNSRRLVDLLGRRLKGGVTGAGGLGGAYSDYATWTVPSSVKHAQGTIRSVIADGVIVETTKDYQKRLADVIHVQMDTQGVFDGQKWSRRRSGGMFVVDATHRYTAASGTARTVPSLRFYTDEQLKRSSEDWKRVNKTRVNAAVERLERLTIIPTPSSKLVVRKDPNRVLTAAEEKKTEALLKSYRSLKLRGKTAAADKQLKLLREKYPTSKAATSLPD